MRNKYIRKTRVGLAVVAVLVSCLFANVTFAGEITGNGKWIAGSPDAPLNGKSACAYSGRQDDPNEPGFKGIITQSWGQIPKIMRDFLTLIGVSPGVACNPTTAQ